MALSRRNFLMGSPLVLAGCATQQQTKVAALTPQADSSYLAMYSSIDTEPFPVPAVDLKRVKRQFLRREVAYQTSETPGTIVVDPVARYAYLVMENGRALRYGVGVGKQEAFNFQGEATIARKAEWPGWRPTPDMIARDPARYGPLKDGLPGGTGNPLGPRALYLYRNNQDTYYRLHGTVEPWTIGTMVSSGCVRLLNQDIMDLYRRVPVGTKVVVLSASATTA
ncbi:L,D-transpeptidase [Rhizobium sp. CG5]|uniref:L,D-transpeptidase n=1 Tax=Rhizobium sp. CG5 TaxID=2726076 RepID=UPI0020343099|nr:L,D-transpeptidase [Rhizobium sp. CG5]MCM2477715.1 L,D-transpeptidase [Rhizobium sp. CG5]